jgi:hypothetical protein
MNVEITFVHVEITLPVEIALVCVEQTLACILKTERVLSKISHDQKIILSDQVSKQD